MPVSFEELRKPKPTEVTVTTPDGEVVVTYDRAYFTSEAVENVYGTLIRSRLAYALLGWDVEMEGERWQPEPLDAPVWEHRAQAGRVAAALSAKRARATVEDADADISTIGLTDDERTEVQAPRVTAAERRAAYAAAWDAIFAQLPRDFLRAIDNGVLDDFLGATWRGGSSASS